MCSAAYNRLSVSYPAAPAGSLVPYFLDGRTARPILTSVERVGDVFQRCYLLHGELWAALERSAEAPGVFLGHTDEPRVDAGSPGALDAVDMVDEVEIWVGFGERQPQEAQKDDLQLQIHCRETERVWRRGFSGKKSWKRLQQLSL